MTHITIENLWKEYSEQVILESLNLEVQGREFCTVVGASGCGKTTFLRMLLGQERPSRGALLLDGKQLPDEPGPDRGIVFQRYSVFPHLTVLGNVLLGLELGDSPWLGRLFGAKRRAATEQAEAALAAVGLLESRDKYPAALSGGMQQRLAIAQSLVKRPKVLLLDEPFGALDPGIRADMHKLIQELWAQTDMTVFMITHDLKEAFELGTRVLVFDKVRLDPHSPQSYGATITYDIPLAHKNEAIFRQVSEAQEQAEAFTRELVMA